MDRLIYTALSGMNDSSNRMRVLANNMANAQTTGFRAEVIAATPVTLKGPRVEARAMADGEVRGASMDPGAVVQTARPLDVAVQGEALLAVQATDGSEAYTRRGDLQVAPTGVLQTGDGHPVIGSSGPISVPLGAEPRIAADGTVFVTDPATPGAPAQAVDRLKLASPAGSTIAKGLDNLFRVPDGGALPADEDARVMPGALEQSNVNATEVVVEMIEAQRLFDLRTKLVATAREVDESSAGLMRMA